MQTGLRFVQHHQIGGTRRQQGGDPQQVAQRAVGQFGLRERSQQSVLTEPKAKPATGVHHVHGGTGKGIGDRIVQGLDFAGFHDRLPGRGKVAAVVGEYGRPGTDLGRPRRRGGIAAEVIVEPPGADALAQHQDFRGALGVREPRQHAVEGRQVLLDHLPITVRIPCLHQGSAPVHHRAAVVPQPAVPDDLPLDDGILAEHRPHRLGEPVVDGIAEIVAGEAEAQVHRLLARSPLNGVVATLDPLGELFGPGPEHRLDAALRRQRLNRRTERGLR